MKALNKQALREAAEKATKGQWAVEFDDEIYSTDGVNHEQIAMVFSENEASDAAFIAAANPATVLALLDELEGKDKRIAELQAMLARLYAECDTGERRGNGSQSGVAMPSWVTVEAARLLLGVK